MKDRRESPSNAPQCTLAGPSLDGLGRFQSKLTWMKHARNARTEAPDRGRSGTGQPWAWRR
eukprot:2987854-Alexandrium_andersonii.AAC.1